jgi:hypothetical protein
MPTIMSTTSFQEWKDNRDLKKKTQPQVLGWVFLSGSVD